MKKSLLLLLLVLMSISGGAAPVSYQQAMMTAQAFMSQKKMKPVKNMQMTFKAPAATASQADAASYYVFNNGDNGGFVIVSGDDRTAQVLGYATTGSFSMENAPENIQAWLQGYAKSILQLDKLNVTQASAKPWKAPSMSAIPVKLTTKWYQNAPYNNACPTVGGSRCVTGCVATAMAQVLYYHRTNSVNATTAAIPQYTSADGLSVTGFPAGTTIDWDNMLPSYGSSATAIQQAAVANLMRLCGTSVNMNYRPTVSGAFIFDVSGAMRKYFGYSQSTTYVRRADYTSADWEKLIYDELVADRPVVYGGQATGGGHAFVIDGYDGNGFFSVNWGWGGRDDGFFLLSILNPGDNSGIGASSTTDGYSSGQDAVIGAQPAVGGETSAVSLVGGIQEIEDDWIAGSFVNLTGEANTFEYGIAYVGAGGELVLIGNAEEASLDKYLANSSNDNVGTGNYFQVTGLPAGTYQIVLVSRVKGSSTWMRSSSYREYVIAQVAGNGQVTLTLVQPEVNLTATAFNFTGTKTANIKQPVEVSIKNQAEEFYGTVYLFASRTTSKGDPASLTGVTLLAGASDTFHFTFTPTVAGTYTIWMATDDKGQNVIGQTTVVIDNEIVMEKKLSATTALVGNTTRVEGQYTVEGKPKTNYEVVGNILNPLVTITNNSTKLFYGTVAAILWNFTDAEYQLVEIPVNLAAGASMQKQLSFTGLRFDNVKYYLEYRYEDSSSIDISDMYTPVGGLTTWTSAGVKTQSFVDGSAVTIPATAVAANVEGLSGVTVTPNANPNTLYYIDNLGNVPVGLTGKNLIVKEVSESITLTDGYDFFVPVSFIAGDISYTRTPAIGTNGVGGWETIALPFKVSAVKQGDKSLEWFKARSEQDKHLWIMDFKEEADGKVVFDYAQTMDACKPYIIAVPDNTWGEEWNLVGKPVTFSGTDARLNTGSSMSSGDGDHFLFWGETVATTLAYAPGDYFYCLNPEGTRFALTQEDVRLQPFRACFYADQPAAAKEGGLTIVFGNDETPADEPAVVTSMAVPFTGEGLSVAVYSLSGTKVAQAMVRNGRADLGSLPHGIYVVNGKKIVK